MINYSIILTTLNEEKRLLGAIQQFEKFNRKDFEVVLVDGGSLDKTVELAKQRTYSFPLVIRQGNFDLNTARNVGIESAKGQVLCFVAANNLLPENYLDRLDRYYDEGFDAVLCLYEMPTDTDNWRGAWAYAQRRLLYDGKENTDEFLWSEGFTCRKELAKKVKFPYVNDGSGAEGWFGKKLKSLGAKFGYAIDIDVRRIAPESLGEFFEERKTRTRGTVYMEFYVYKLSKTNIIIRAIGRAITNFLMFLIQVPSVLYAFELLTKAKNKNLKSFAWFFFAGQVDLLARMIGKLRAIFVIKNAKQS